MGFVPSPPGKAPSDQPLHSLSEPVSRKQGTSALNPIVLIGLGIVLIGAVGALLSDDYPIGLSLPADSFTVAIVIAVIGVGVILGGLLTNKAREQSPFLRQPSLWVGFALILLGLAGMLLSPRGASTIALVFGMLAFSGAFLVIGTVYYARFHQFWPRNRSDQIDQK